MRFKVGQKVLVKTVFSGGNFESGDIVVIKQIGCDDDPDCYGAISPYDGLLWFLNEEEVGPVTNADAIRAMSDEDLAIMFAMLKADLTRLDMRVRSYHGQDVNDNYDWLKQPYSDD